MTTPDEARQHADRLIVEAHRAGIDNHREIANLLAQAQVETGNFGRLVENMNYRPEGLLAIFPGRNGMNTLAEAQAIAKGGPEGIANTIYGGDWGKRALGNTEQGDGWDFRGRGYFQITGRANYAVANEALGARFGVDLLDEPERLAEPRIAAAAAVDFWKREVVALGAQDDVDLATGIINKARLELDARRAHAAEWERKLDTGYVAVDPDLPPPRPIDPRNPARMLFESVLSQVESHERERGIAGGPHTTKLSCALAEQATCDQLDRVDRVEFNEMGSHARAIQFGAHGDDPLFNRRSQPVEIAHVLARSAEEGFARMEAATPRPMLDPSQGLQQEMQQGMSR